MPTFSESIKNYCKNLGGSCHPYSQSHGVTGKLIETSVHTKDGICHALAAKWLVETAKAGGNFWFWLTEGNNYEMKNKVLILMQNFKEFQDPTDNDPTDKKINNLRRGIQIDPAHLAKVMDLRSGSYQDNLNRLKKMDFQGIFNVMAEDYLKRGGLKSRPKNARFTGSPRDLRKVDDQATNLLLALYAPNTVMGYSVTQKVCVMIIIQGSDSAHAMAFISYGAGYEENYSGYMFFDPNHGEYSFNTYKDFSSWFQYFWKWSYSCDYDSFYLYTYGPVDPANEPQNVYADARPVAPPKIPKPKVAPPKVSSRPRY